MRRLCLVVLVTATVLLSGVAPARADETRARGVATLGQVQKIHVGDMGRADEAERFRLLLEEQLARRGFTVVGRQEDADAVLIGALSVRVLAKGSQARVFVKLESTQNGGRLWARDFGHKRLKNPFDLTEPTRRRAEDVAKALRRDWEKATK